MKKAAAVSIICLLWQPFCDSLLQVRSAVCNLLYLIHINVIPAVFRFKRCFP